MKALVHHTLQRAGYSVIARDGARPLDAYSIRRTRLPEHVVTRMPRPVELEVDLHRITTPCGFSYRPGGWHPYRETLAQLIAEPDLPYERTAVRRFYDRFQPRTVQEALLEDVRERLEPLASWPPLLPLFKHLWNLTPRAVEQILRAPDRAKGPRQQFGPQPPEFGSLQVQRLHAAYDSVRDSGYRPDAFPDGALLGYFLVRDGDYRFVVFNGNHRLAAFEALGIERVVARPYPGHPPVIEADRLEPWTTGRHGIFPAAVARALFDKLFDETGWDKAVGLGIV